MVYGIKHIAAKVKILAFLASFSISTVHGDFLQMGLARVLLSHLSMAWINGELDSKWTLAMDC